jgi:hypothetical protein
MRSKGLEHCCSEHWDRQFDDTLDAWLWCQGVRDMRDRYSWAYAVCGNASSFLMTP